MHDQPTQSKWRYGLMDKSLRVLWVFVVGTGKAISSCTSTIQYNCSVDIKRMCEWWEEWLKELTLFTWKFFSVF